MAGGSNYLDAQEDLYNLPAPLPAGLAEQASAIIDNALKRTEGLIFVADSNGNPSYMKALTPSYTYKIGPLSPGTNVQTTINGSIRADMVGEPLVLDRANPDVMETVVVQAIAQPNKITFSNVQFSHADQATADVGMLISEQRSLPSKRSIARFTRAPMANLVSLMGQYGYGRRSDQVGGLYQEMNLLASVQQFGGPPLWVPIPLADVQYSNETCDIWVPAGLLLAYYSDVRIRYVAGFPSPPDSIVRATAAVAASLVASGAFGGVTGIRTIAAGDTRIERFGATNLDDDTRKMIAPYTAQLFY